MPRFPSLSALDARRWKVIAVGFILFGGAGLILALAAPALGLAKPGEIQRWVGAAHGPWALPSAIAAFAVLAFVGVPQIALIAAAVVVFGPERGALYSWIATMISALTGFGVGRAFGARFLAGGGPTLRRLMASLGRNGFIASLTVRLAPFAPFVLINTAAGVAPMRLFDFAAGTAIGIVPKILLTAFAGGSLTRALKGGGSGSAVLASLAIAALFIVGAIARRWSRNGRGPGGSAEVSGPLDHPVTGRHQAPARGLEDFEG
jgi:uncharacterized membrane protein YdjX (TVP38/TMEM64 family)